MVFGFGVEVSSYIYSTLIKPKRIDTMKLFKIQSNVRFHVGFSVNREKRENRTNYINFMANIVLPLIYAKFLYLFIIFLG